MSLSALSSRAVAAAQRCHADPRVWMAAHELHLGRKPAAVRHITQGIVEGDITGVSDDGFTVSGYGEIAWPAALAVAPAFNETESS